MSSHRPRIIVVSTGGTITMTPSAGGIVPSLTADDLLASVPGLAELADITTSNPVMKPSPSLSVDDVATVAAELATAFAQGATGAVVIQGTDTMEETAFLYELLLRGPQPVVITGAMRGASAVSADGPANLLAAARVAASPDAAGRGAMVVMNDEIHAAVAVQKSHSTLLSAFSSPLHGRLGLLVEGRPLFLQAPSRPVAALPVRPLPVGAPTTPVALLPAALDDGDRLLSALPQLGYGGLVLQAMGAGHVPQRQRDAVVALARTMPVLLASRIGHGISLRATYGFPGSERDLLANGLLSAGWLDSRKARLLLAWLLSTGAGRDDIAQAVQAFSY